jgi:hypothetical protein
MGPIKISIPISFNSDFAVECANKYANQLHMALSIKLIVTMELFLN